MSEKNYAPGLKEKKISNKEVKANAVKEKAPIKEETKKVESTKVEQKPVKKNEIKRDFAIVNIPGAKISTKVSVSICNFIRGKKINKAIENLEQVILKKKAVPMKGEFAHRKGDNIMSGKYPVDASKEFIIFLKSLQSNAIQNGIENAYVTEAISNMGSRPYGRFGRVKRKRTHIKLVAKEKKK